MNSTFRMKRFEYFLKAANEIPSKELRILDVGGEEAYWLDKIPLFKRAVSITLLNIFPISVSTPNMISVHGDARDISNFADNSFDIVHSNSVIEHVGKWRDMRAMADEIRRLAPRYFVQTPYFWFPMEPHFGTIGFHWLPESLRAKLISMRRLGFVEKASNFDEAMTYIQGSSLLDHSMMESLFPDASIIFEKWGGVPKSIMAVRR